MKLADFGCSKCDDTTVSFTTIGSVLWMAPEVIRGKQGGHGRKADIWSLGCVFLEMATAEKPWGNSAFDNQMQALMHIEGSDCTPPIPSNLPAAGADLIRQCVQRDRTCPFATGWNYVTKLSGPNTYEHIYAECSNKGECDRKSGECKCFDGYTGSACRRMKCDDDCNGHGVCETLHRSTWVSNTDVYTGWDAKKIQVCVCDPGYEGDKCEKKKCKKGDDPMTLANNNAGTWTAQAAEVQTIA